MTPMQAAAIIAFACSYPHAWPQKDCPKWMNLCVKSHMDNAPGKIVACVQTPAEPCKKRGTMPIRLDTAVVECVMRMNRPNTGFEYCMDAK